MAKLVYASGPDGSRDVCPRCGDGTCRCREQANAKAAADHDLRVRIEKSGRGGKVVTTIAPLFLEQNDAKALLKRFKKRCGCGGALKRGEAGYILEIQGEKREQILQELVKLGYPAKAAGG